MPSAARAPNPAVRPPQQRRSRETLERILDAAEELLADRTFDELAIHDVVRRAKASVGAFYARFPDKDVLLNALYDRHQSQIKPLIRERLDPGAWKGVPLAEAIRKITRELIRFHRCHRGLLRALVLRGYARPDPAYADPHERAQFLLIRFRDFVCARQSEVTHPDPALASKLACLALLATLREKLLFGDSTARALRIADARLEKELTDMICLYLGVKS